MVDIKNQCGSDTIDRLGAEISAARMRVGLTRKELAGILRVTPRHLMSIENGWKKPSYALLYRLIRELSIPADRIFYPEYPNEYQGIERVVGMLLRCDEKEVGFISATLSVLMDQK